MFQRGSPNLDTRQLEEKLKEGIRKEKDGIEEGKGSYKEDDFKKKIKNGKHAQEGIGTWQLQEEEEEEEEEEEKEEEEVEEEGEEEEGEGEEDEKEENKK